MDEYTTFEEADLTRIGLVCGRCKTEVILDLDGPDIASNSESAKGAFPRLASPLSCPRCGSHLLNVFNIPVGLVFTWVSLYKWAATNDKPAAIRFYFRKARE